MGLTVNADGCVCVCVCVCGGGGGFTEYHSCEKIPGPPFANMD